MNIKELITNNTINDLIHELGAANRLFKSEAQFQFELAWSIKTFLQDKCCEDSPEVHLEYLSAIRKNGRQSKKIFTDILILDANGRFIPIELKYKTVSNKAGSVFDDYGDHGATDLGRFDYLWDVKRIQYLKHRDEKSFLFNEDLQEFCRGFAILLTNDHHYWDATVSKKESKNPLYLSFCIGEGDTIPKGKELEWKNKGKGTCVENTWRNDHDYVVPLVFDQDYHCKWLNYNNDETFKVLVLEV